MRIRLDIAYDGTHFRGWARQPGLRTVQGTLEQALARILGGEPRLIVAGRTDAGVHAAGQVAHLDLGADQERRLLQYRRGDDPDVQNSTDSAPGEPSARRVAGSDGQIGGVSHTHPPASDPIGRLAARIRGVVGAYSDVAVLRASAAPEGFDARFSAVWRRYSYRVADGATGYDPLERHRTTTVRTPLDVEAMDAAARSLIGLHDFAAYCKPREEATTIRTLLEFDWRRDAEAVLVANIKADAFCHSMVRALVGACVAVGQGRLELGEVARIRDDAQRTNAFTVLAARGLTLIEVGYPEVGLLGRRAEQTRARRDRE